MLEYVASETIKALARSGQNISGATVTIFGLTFKEDCPDIRNTKVIDLIDELKNFHVNIQICDPWARDDEAKHAYGGSLTPMDKLSPANAIIFAVGHKKFKDLTANSLSKYCREKAIVVDIKGFIARDEIAQHKHLELIRL